MTGAQAEQFAPVAVVSRNGVDESVHFGAAVCIAVDGSVAHTVGDGSVAVYPRSSTKPLQALAMVRAGLALPPRLLALVCASHNGQQMHLDGVREILATAGLDESALRNIADHPLHAASAHDAVRAGREKSPLQMNCSGKHAGMLATCVVNGWPLETYLDPAHPLQLAINDAVTGLCGEPVAIGTDGCGAPAHVIPLESLARAFRAIAVGDAGAAGNQVFEAMSNHSDMVGGDDRDVTQIVSALPGFFAKDGAEAVYAGASSDGRAAAVKISDGGGRGRVTVFLAALETLGFDVSTLAEVLAERVLGHGKPVGGVRAVGFGAHVAPRVPVSD
ncbi:MAG: asparaginase [Ilumatobacteraceae bacterium]